MTKARKAVSRVAATRKQREITSITLPITPRLRQALRTHAAYVEAKAAYDTAIRPVREAHRKLSEREQDRREIVHTPEQERMRQRLGDLERRAEAAYAKLAVRDDLLEVLPPRRILEASLANWTSLISGRVAAYSLMQLSLAAIR